MARLLFAVVVFDRASQAEPPIDLKDQSGGG